MMVMVIVEDHFVEEDGDDDVEEDEGIDKDEADEEDRGGGALFEEGSSDGLGPRVAEKDLEQGPEGLEEVSKVDVAKFGARAAFRNHADAGRIMSTAGPGIRRKIIFGSNDEVGAGLGSTVLAVDGE